MTNPDAQEPKFPLQARLISPQHVDVTPRNMLGLLVKVDEPAQGAMSARSTRALGQQSMKNALGTHRPAKALLGLDSTNSFLLMLPTHSEDPDGTEIRYEGGRGYINLVTIFQGIDRLVPSGINEYYALKPATEKITVGSATGYGMVMPLEVVHSAPIDTLTDAEKAARRVKSDARKKKTQGGQG